MSTINPATLVQSKDYASFSPHAYQQAMSERHVKKLAFSMQENGFWPSKPISVVQTASGKFTIVDGHHRLAAAKSLSIPFYYVTEPKNRLDEIGNINVTVRAWQTISFAKMEAAKGNPHYVELLRYVDKGIPLRQAASLLRGESAQSGNASPYVRNGTFTVKSRENIDTICSFLDEFGATSPVVKSGIFIESLSILLFVKEFDVEQMKQKIQNNPAILQKCNNRLQMLDQLEEVYNFRSHAKIPLAFLGKEEMIKRKRIWEK